MTYTQHPLSAAFPAMSDDELNARIDGVIPSSQQFIDRVIASDWFQGLKKSQRAAYAVRWFHFHAKGSNQHKCVIDTTTARYAAEQAQRVIQKAQA
jgi:hypothetical protein